MRVAVRAGVAKLADARDLKSRDPEGSCGFDPHPRHQISLVYVDIYRLLSLRLNSIQN